jgi:hypothetical protein
VAGAEGDEKKPNKKEIEALLKKGILSFFEGN